MKRSSTGRDVPRIGVVLVVILVVFVLYATTIHDDDYSARYFCCCWSFPLPGLVARRGGVLLVDHPRQQRTGRRRRASFDDEHRGRLLFAPAALVVSRSKQQQERAAAASTRGDATCSSCDDGGVVFSFDEMKGLDRRLKELEESAPGYLMDFYEPHLASFSIKPGTAERISITSTCYAVRAILASGGSRITSPYREVDLERVLQELLYSRWREEDLYQVALVSMVLFRSDLTISRLDTTMTLEKVFKLVSLVLSARPKRRFGLRQAFSEYISYLCCSVYASLFTATSKRRNRDEQEGGKSSVGGDLLPPESIIPEGMASELSVALARCAETSFDEMCRQIAYRSANDSASFDTIRLVYSMLSYLRSTDALRDTAGRERVAGEGPEDRTQPLKMNKRLVREALAIFFDEQKDDGMWDRGQPIYKSFRRQGRNIGNAYVFGLDALGSLLEILPPEDLRPYLGQLAKSLEWIETHQTVEMIADYCDAESGQCYGKPLRGWASPHLTERLSPAPQAWSTAQTVTCIVRLRRTVQQLMHNDVLAEFNGIAHSKVGPLPEAWDRLLDSDLGSGSASTAAEGGGGCCRTIKSVLEERVCTPFARSVSNPSVGAAYSVILFGSPGTAKTTISEAVAEKMGWDFVVIDTAAFLADGLTNVASRIRYVFERLQALRECVILFDEIEEFCLDRENPGLSMESRMLTTAMLTAINDLRRTKQSVFFLATNRLRAFDAAIIRPGRFDVQLFVGTPNLEARVTLFEQALAHSSSSSTMSSDEAVKDKAIETYRGFLRSVWSEDGDAMFMNYLEGKQLAESAASIVESGGGGSGNKELEYSDLQRLLDQQAAVMTCRGAVRDEYKAQMGLSRL